MQWSIFVWRICLGLFIVLVVAVGCTLDTPFAGSGYPKCETDEDCVDGCKCLNGEICVPAEEDRDPWYCDESRVCETDEDCEPYCVCKTGRCEPPEPSDYPDYCENGPPECEDDSDCDHQCVCKEFECVPTVETSYPDYCENGPPECEHDSDCLYGCGCREFECVPLGGRPENYCEGDVARCDAKFGCRLGCVCVGGFCESAVEGVDDDYCAWGPAPTCMEPDLVVTSNLDFTGVQNGEMSLREALSRAAQQSGPHRIFFEDPDRFSFYFVKDALGPLPPVPPLTYLDGGEGVSLRSEGDGTGAGITADGVGIVVSDIKIVGFPECGVRVAPGASQVHLFRMRIGAPAAGLANGSGIEIHSGAHHVVIGRGRELECVEPVKFEANTNNIGAYDINVITANQGFGIIAVEASDLSIYGTWIGFNNRDDYGYGDWRWGNGGTGIFLDHVERAVIGAQYLTETETMDGPDDPLPAFVGVGRNAVGGIEIVGGGNIHMPGVMLGDTPNMVPYDENMDFNLRIEGNTGPVYFGPAPDAHGPAARYFGISYSETATPFWITGNQAEVWIRGVQNECFQENGCPGVGVFLQDVSAPVKLHHMTFVYDFPDAGVELDSLGENGSLEIINSLFFRMAAGDTPVLESHMSVTENITLRSNVAYHFGDWCVGQCPDILEDANLNTGESFICTSDHALPLAPNCPNVDAGEAIIGPDLQPMNLTGESGVPHYGCGPDVGFYECNTPICLQECN